MCNGRTGCDLKELTGHLVAVVQCCNNLGLLSALVMKLGLNEAAEPTVSCSLIHYTLLQGLLSNLCPNLCFHSCLKLQDSFSNNSPHGRESSSPPETICWKNRFKIITEKKVDGLVF